MVDSFPPFSFIEQTWGVGCRPVFLGLCKRDSFAAAHDFPFTVKNTVDQKQKLK